MNNISKRLDDALGIDLDKVLSDSSVTPSDAGMLQKHQDRKEHIDKVKQNLKDARSMSNKEWAQALLKRSADTLMMTQEVFSKEIEDNPASKNISALGELSNALTATISEVVKIDQEEEKIAISKEKNSIRRDENSASPILNMGASSNVIAIGKGSDILTMLRNGLDPAQGL